ncbi:small heat shock protein, putative [Plasmodium chabaudi chabaudi]|uniref:Small heat shock protein, putative n=1 Tax=Plasmodium chabaudi chabaudi TaxID=31271 RepID=A0A1D3S2B1_PLACU|nr:small heat shock protein, putative [Plasmodium chabaudi chabaudi]
MINRNFQGNPYNWNEILFNPYFDHLHFHRHVFPGHGYEFGNMMGSMNSHMFNHDFFGACNPFRVRYFGYNCKLPMNDDFSYVQNESTSLIPLDIRDKGKGYEIKMYFPDISKENLRIRLFSNCIEIVSASNKIIEKIDDYTSRYIQEKRESSHIQAVPIPRNVRVKDISANLKDGILRIYMPKKYVMLK